MVIDNQVESGLTLFLVPADKEVSWGDFPDGGAFADGPEEMAVSLR